MTDLLHCINYVPLIFMRNDETRTEFVTEKIYCHCNIVLVYKKNGDGLDLKYSFRQYQKEKLDNIFP